MKPSCLGLLSTLWILASTETVLALPLQTAQRSTLPGYMDQFYTYLNDQKFTQVLGEDRGACAYNIDPTDIYQQGTNRFLTAKITAGMSGTACRGYFELTVVQVDCRANTLYQFRRETEGDPRFRGWQRVELSLRNPADTTVRNASQQAARQICSLPTKPR